MPNLVILVQNWHSINKVGHFWQAWEIYENMTFLEIIDDLGLHKHTIFQMKFNAVGVVVSLVLCTAIIGRNMDWRKILGFCINWNIWDVSSAFYRPPNWRIDLA